MRRRTLRYFLFAASLIISLTALRVAPDFFGPLDHVLNDWRTRLSLSTPLIKKAEKEQRVVVVDIDEQSLAAQGPWPWPRNKIADLVTSLIDHYGAAGVALDIVFPEVKKNETALSGQLQRPEVTGAVVYDLMARQQPELKGGLPPFVALDLPTDAPRIVGLPVTSNHPGLMPSRVGHITPLFDTDGSIRHLPPFACHRVKVNECRPLLGISAFMGLLTDASLKVTRGEGFLSPAWEISINAGKEAEVVKIPMNQDGTLTIPYRHRPQDWTAFSATAVLAHTAPTEKLRGSMVLVGATALGMSDVVFTPVSPVASGLEPHAEVMVALLDNGFLTVPQYGWLMDLLLLIPIALLLYFLVLKFDSPGQRAGMFIAWLGLSWMYGTGITLLFYLSLNLLVPLTPFALFPLVAILLIVSIEFYFLAREKNGISGLLGAYLPMQVAQRLTESNKHSHVMDTSVDASRRKITVMFADVRGFAGIAEGHKPEIVAKLMHQVFSEMAASVVSHHGTIDKFIGDAVMAFWNAPEDDPLHAFHALAAAQDMLRRMHQLAPFCESLGVPPVKIGIGLETGYALVGNFGSQHRRTYTALGETVVLASRIEGLTAQYRRSVLIGETCASALNMESLEPLGEAQIRGRQQVIRLFAPKWVPAQL